ELSIRVIRHLGVIGECNIQFALDPESDDYRVIEVNARLSRSSALASKATGYPLAFVAAKLSLGYGLPELRNSITKVTTACFEPALDYIVVKIPRWDLKKFVRVSNRIGSGMKSVGEVMAIGRNFEETVQKAIRMLGQGMHGFVCNKIRFKDIESELREPTDERIFAVSQALWDGMDIEKMYQLSRIDRWFLCKLANIMETKRKLMEKKSAVPADLMRKAKKQGFSDNQVAILTDRSMLEVREMRKSMGIIPSVKQIDTLGGEYPAKTNYLYLTYDGLEDDIDFQDDKSVIVLGSGAYRIGSSVEFDWCCVSCINALSDLGYKTVMINYNPETVSTDYDTCDRLYFDELSFERVLDIYEKEKPTGVVVSVGGQIPNNLAMKLYERGVKVLGTSPLSIDNAEDRHKFSALLDRLKIDQPAWKELTSIQEAKQFASNVGFPVLIRPSYVLSGAAMNVAMNEQDLEQFLEDASDVSKEYPVVITKFVTDARELEIDAVADKGRIVCWAISEHVENAGVHSGDATMVLPPQKTYIETIRRIKKVAARIAESLKITGPFNIQFLAKENEIKVIECNLRSSRSFPFVSKVTKTNFIEVATKAMLGLEPKVSVNSLDLDYVGVKAPQFSFTRLHGADPILRVEMASTGEVACIGTDLHDAFLKSVMSAGLKLPDKSVLLSISGDKRRFRFLEEVKLLHELGFRIFATEHTSEFYSRHGIPTTMVYKAHNKHKQNNVLSMIEQKKLDLVINVTKEYDRQKLEDSYLIRRRSVDFAIPLFTNLQVAKLFVESLARKDLNSLEVRPWSEYI
ncbi:carbamoyl-phosphate synthase (glutamine-hydrolyzing) large subunit, partial [Candidatus Woesearchaeota archaeon]|nr:carbamoyl-phosphate synthase (glutamine-hydrolyzing) large subunit [Candidatus Woesearchaeota archaeon]